MGKIYFRRNFFWLSFFAEQGKKKIWVSKTSLLVGSVSLISGVIFLLFIYFTVGAAVKLSASLDFGSVNFIYLLFLLIYAFLLSALSFFFFKDLFSVVKIEYGGENFSIQSPIRVKKYVGVFFITQTQTIRSKLVSIEYSKVLFDIFSEGAEYYYTLDFVFENGKKLRFPFIYTSSDLLNYFIDNVPMIANVRFGHFTLHEVQAVADFFNVPSFSVD